MKKRSKNIIVKQPLGISLFFIGAGILYLILFLYSKDNNLCMRLLASSMFVVPIWCVALYYFKWYISFGSDGIVFRGLICTREYSYGNILSVTEYHSSKPGRSLKITFSDGKLISVPDYCKNYELAKREIMKHISIKVCGF